MKEDVFVPERMTDQCGDAGSLPALPRLQFRWEDGVGSGTSFFAGQPVWKCHYELVLPLQEGDIRREIYGEDGEQTGERAELVVPIKGPCLRGKNGSLPCVDRFDGDKLHYDEPFRDGVHAQWDAALLGNLPIYCVTLDGTLIRKPENEASQ